MKTTCLTLRVSLKRGERVQFSIPVPIWMRFGWRKEALQMRCRTWPLKVAGCGLARTGAAARLLRLDLRAYSIEMEPLSS